ncbi:MAG: hypothetical protein HRT69_14120 [Flavobacteriaceae bacterium]|nr:hypothetical protein [Flavobacteriaceae bacterium]
MNSEQTDTNKLWLTLLSEAIKSGENVKANHRYRFKGQNLGTYLVGLKKRGTPELLTKIKELGFDLEKTSRTPENAAKKLIEKLLVMPKIKKSIIQTDFNNTVLPRKEGLSVETIDRINKLWEDLYNEARSWTPPLTTIDKIIKWKEFRYDKKRNPNRKWHQGLSYMGDLYTWVYNLKNDEYKINSIIGVFNEKEKRELISEGFPVK